MTHSLGHVTWIGGSPCAGKSSLAAALAERYGMTVYGCDDHVERHVREADPATAATLIRLSKLDCEGLWMRPVDQQVREEIAFYDDELPLILRDLAAIPADCPVIAEGAALMPRLLHEMGNPPDRAIWIVPTPTFQRTHYARRDWRHDVLRSCADPDRAWENWMARDEGFAAHVAAEARQLGYRVITVDGSRPIAKIRAEVETHLGLAGP
jgi:adenylate kinase family enzyme